MRLTAPLALVAAAVALTATAGCSALGGGGAAETEVVVVTRSPAAAPSSAAGSSTPSSTVQAAVDTTGTGAGDGCGVVGITKAPGAEPAHCMDKQIDHCGSATMQAGTTFFTDGSSGWTSYCAEVMRATVPTPTYPAYTPPKAAEPTVDQQTRNQQFADEYWQNHPKPTFDPDSADGYGPNQQLPPACLRLKDVNC